MQAYYMKICYYNHIAEADRTEYKAVLAKSMSVAIAIIEDYYENDLISVEIRTVDNNFIMISEEVFLNCYNY